uniref:Reverse transcriptase domain-containing protein n=1 Tax=Cacopsylla melanoneura TaxID=428564 RepID=A0A8D8LEC4_9HEMI
MWKCLCSRNINLQLRTRVLKCYVFSTLLYGAEAWTLKRNNEKNINAFEMWCYRRMLRIPWTKRVTNVEVLRRMNKNMELEHTIKKRKLEYLGHILRGTKYKMLNLILEGRIEGRRSRGRRRKSWRSNLREWFECDDHYDQCHCNFQPPTGEKKKNRSCFFFKKYIQNKVATLSASI